MKNSLINIANSAIEAGLLASLAFIAFFYGGVEIWSQAVFESTVLVIFFIWILKIVSEGRLSLNRSRLDAPVIVFFILAAVSRFVSIYQHTSQMSLNRIIGYTMIYFLIVNNFASSSKLRRLTFYIITLVALVSLIGIIGYFNQPAISSVWGYAGFASFTTTSHFAGYAATVFCLPLALLLAAKGYRKVYYIICSVLISAAILFCQDKGGWVQSIAAVSFLIISASYSGILKRRAVLLLFIGILFIWAISLFGFQLIINRLAPIFTLDYRGSPEATIWQRWVYWQDAIKMIIARPLFGTGIGTFSVAYPQFRSPEVVNLLNYAHQDFLQLASEMGLLGLGVFGWILYGFFRSGFHLIKENIGSSKKALISGVLAGAFGLLVHSLYDFNLHIPSNAMLFVVFIAIVSAFLHLSNIESDKKHKFWIDLKLNFFLKGAIFLVGTCLISFFLMSVIRPYLAHLHYEKAQAFEDSLDWERAIKEYDKAKSLDPKNSHYYYALGNIYAARAHFDFLETDNNIELAISNYHKAIRLNPQKGDFYFTLANLYNVLGQKESATKNFQQASSLDPNNKVYQAALQ